MSYKVIDQSEDSDLIEEIVLRKQQMLDALGVY